MRILITLLLATAVTVSAVADVVVPVASVEKFVNIRFAPDASSEIVGHLRARERMPLVNSKDGWYEVQLVGGGTGFVSADWAVVITDAEAAAAMDIEASGEPQTVDDQDAAEKPSASAADDAADEVGVVEEPASVETSPAADEAPLPAAVAPVRDETAGTIDTTSGESVAVPPATARADVETSYAVPDTHRDAANDTTAPQTGNARVDEDTGAAMAVDVPAWPEDAPADPSQSASDTGETVSAPAVDSGTSGDMEGSVDYVVKFVAPTEGGNSQIFDDGRNIGIGTTEPKQRLEVNGNIQIHQRNSNVAGLMITQASGETGYIMHNRASTLTIGAGSVDRITVDRDGNVGIGVARPSYPLELANGAHVTAGGVWTNSSSRDNKENIRSLTPEEALSALAGLEPVRFNYKGERDEEYVGFIAEDVPELVASADRRGLSAMDIVALLTRVVQQQQHRIDALEARLDGDTRDPTH